MYAIPTLTLTLVAAGLLAAAPDLPRRAAFDATVQSPDVTPEPPEDDEGQHFCCEKVNKNPGGEGCIMIGKEHTGSCSNLLHCSGNWTKEDGTVNCY